MTNVVELLDRKYDRGSTITNCVSHIHLDITERPDDCKLCLGDLRNHMSHAISVNKWLNEWKDDATKILHKTDTKTLDLLIKDVDFALGRYGMSASHTSGPTEEQKNEWFEEARLALRRVRDLLASLRQGE